MAIKVSEQHYEEFMLIVCASDAGLGAVLILIYHIFASKVNVG